MTAGKPFFITTPIYYVNDTPHLGHAYPTVAADALARFMRLDGRQVKFLTGTDEHGQKVERSAQALGLTPQQFAGRVSAAFRKMDRLLDISNDDYIRTTEARHIRGVQALWRELERRGEIYLGRFAGWYCVRDEAFYDESELIDGPNGVRVAPTGAEVEWVGGQLLLSPVGLAGPVIGLVRGSPRGDRAAQPP
jgi:methionyl-tRNA synthetase